ncbi:hypothetical protein BJ912DRAFT_930197, partial [Pholiota molesta]
MVHERHNALKPARSAQHRAHSATCSNREGRHQYPSDITSSAHIGDTAGSTATPVLNVPAEQPYRPTGMRRQARVPTSNRLSARNLLATLQSDMQTSERNPVGRRARGGCLHDIGTHRASVQHSDRLDRLRAREVIHGHHCAESKKYEQRAAPSTTRRRRGVTGCPTHGVPWTTTARLASVGDAGTERHTKSTATREQDIWTTSAHIGRAPTFRSNHKGTGATQHGRSNLGKPALQRQHHYHRERPWFRTIYGHRSVVGNETTTLRYGRLTAWHRLYDYGSTREGVGEQRSCGKTS